MGYIRFGKTIYVNLYAEDRADKLRGILESKKVEFKEEKINQGEDWVDDEPDYAWCFEFNANNELLTEIAEEMSSEDVVQSEK